MASAWQQVAGILQANQALKEAQLARSVTQQLYRQHFQPAQTETLLSLTGPLHSKLLAGATTILGGIRGSSVPERMLSGVFRRISRLPSRLALATPGAPTLLSRVSSGAITIIPPPAAPGGMVSIDQITSKVSPPPTSTPTLATALQFENFTPQAIASVPARPGFEITTTGTALAAGPTSGADSAQAAGFRSAASQLFAYFQALPANPAALPPLNIPTLSSSILSKINPITTIPNRVRSLITLSAQLFWKPLDPLEPIMAAPSFPQPMYAPLRDLSPSYLMPGVESIPPNSLGLLQANRRFIEAYMVGLNHETSRQLLWNGYPTDQRGSYFRQFWDVSSYVPQATDPANPAQLAEELKDIPPINTWVPLTVPLGQHPNRTDIVQNNLVLMVRGELFKRYPNAIVYAARATRNAQGELALDPSDERYPLFRGTLSPDMTFLGFNLTAADAHGGTAEFPDGVFFVFQEQPSEPRFGLEPTAASTPVTEWSDLAWTNFATGGGTGVVSLPLSNRSQTTILMNSPWRLASQVFSLVGTNVSLPNFLSPSTAPTGVAITAGSSDSSNNWGVNSAQTAYILLRLPFRVLILASLMLPPA